MVSVAMMLSMDTQLDRLEQESRNAAPATAPIAGEVTAAGHVLSVRL
jgi:hypothetical protein